MTQSRDRPTKRERESERARLVFEDLVSFCMPPEQTQPFIRGSLEKKLFFFNIEYINFICLCILKENCDGHFGKTTTALHQC